MRSILLNAANDRGWESRYGVARTLARAFAGHLHCLQATPFVDTGEGFFGFYPYPEIARELHEVGRQHRTRAEDRLRGEGVDWDWQEVMDDQAQALIRRSRLADILVVSTGAKAQGKPGTEDLAMAGSIAIHARGPVLAVPPELTEFDPLGTALIAWNGSPEAAGALRSGLPLLKQAKAVRLMAVGGDNPDPRRFTVEDALGYLKRHDVDGEARPWKPHDVTVASALLDAAAALDADYIVAGAYGHTRLREAVLGGTTRGLLCHSTIPLLITH